MRSIDDGNTAIASLYSSPPAAMLRSPASTIRSISYPFPLHSRTARCIVRFMCCNCFSRVVRPHDQKSLCKCVFMTMATRVRAASGSVKRRNVVHTPFVKKIFSIPLAGSGEKCEQTMEYLLATNKPLFALGMKMKGNSSRKASQSVESERCVHTSCKHSTSIAFTRDTRRMFSLIRIVRASMSRRLPPCPAHTPGRSWTFQLASFNTSVRPGRDRLSASSCAFVRTSSSRIARALASTKTALVEGPDVMWSRRGCL